MKTWMTVVVVAVAVAAAFGCKKKCPECPPAPDCPKAECPVDANPAEAPYTFVYVKDEKTGNQAMIATTVDNKVIVVPLDPAKIRVFLDGKESTLGEAVPFARGPGGCPCQNPPCWPYCRPAADVLGKEPTDFYGTGGGTGTGGTAPAPQ